MSEDELVGAPKVSSELSPWPVSRLSLTLKEWIERLGVLWIEGELASIKIGPSNMFGELRDLQIENSVSIHSWNVAKIPADLKQGDRVLALIKPAFWPKGGKLTMQVMEMRKVGLGELLERIERLRAQLTAEGLTSIERKQPLPFLPNKIGLITGKDSDAEKDVLQNARLRWPNVEFRTIHTLVQGDKAAPEVIAAIKTLDEDPEVDVIIITRGGGSFEDLLPFSDESLVRLAASCTTAIVSAIGHEKDSPLLDLVADYRASTPTDAAKRVVPDIAQEISDIEKIRDRMYRRLVSTIDYELNQIAQLLNRPVMKDPSVMVKVRVDELNALRDRSNRGFKSLLEIEKKEIKGVIANLRSLSPQSTMDRGYSVVQSDDGKIVRDATKLKAGAVLRIRAAKGETRASVLAEE